MIKEYSQPISNSSIIIVEFCENKNNINIIQGIVETTISLSYMLLSYNYIHYICWHDKGKDYFNKVIISSKEDILKVAWELLSLTTYEDVMDCKRIKKDSFYWYQKVIESNGEKYFKKFYVTSNIPKENISYLEENENMDILYLKDKSEVNLSNLKVIDINNLKESLENLVMWGE